MTALALSTALGSAAMADDKGTDINEFYKGVVVSEITPANMQSWQNYKYTSTRWDEYGIFGVSPIMAPPNPATLKMADEMFDIGQEFQEGLTFVDSMVRTQTKGFMILKDNVVHGEFYDNYLEPGGLQLLQSSSKTYAGVIVSKLIDDGLIDPSQTVASYLADFEGSAIGEARVQHVLDMQSGLLPATDYHIPGGEAFEFEIEQGLKPGDATGHRAAVIAAERPDTPGTNYNYNDKNTDLLAMLAEGVTGLPFNKHLSNLFGEFGSTSGGSVALTIDGTASPSYGISTTLHDYALFHQWIAQGKAPKSFYASAQDANADLFQHSETGQAVAGLLGTTVTHKSQIWGMPEHEIIYSVGSYGQVGISHLPSGTSIVFMSDWEDNGVPSKYKNSVDRAMFVLEQLGVK